MVSNNAAIMNFRGRGRELEVVRDDAWPCTRGVTTAGGCMTGTMSAGSIYFDACFMPRTKSRIHIKENGRDN